MALSRIKTWSAGEVLTASDLNTEFNNILGNALSLISPITGALDLDGNSLTLDAAAATSVVSSTAVSWNFTSGAKTGTPATTGSVANWSAQTFTDSATAGSGTATAFVAYAIQRPTLAATNASVVTTNAATLYVANAPAAGTNETLTNAYSLWLDDGDARLDGQICGIGSPVLNELRLTLTTGVPVTTGDVTAAGTLYLSPLTGSHITVFDGSIWKTFSTAEISLALTLTSGKPYDIFAVISAGAVTLESLVWTNDTTRATALTTQNGVLVKTGATTRRYLGTLYSSGANTTEDSVAKRYLWNYYHRFDRPMQVLEATDSWTYTLVAFQQARATATNQLDVVRGVEEDPVIAEVTALFTSDQASNSVNAAVGIGIDSSTTSSAQIMDRINNIVSQRSTVRAKYVGFPGVGRRTLRWLEQSDATGTTTWFGDNGVQARSQCGIIGVMKG